MIPNLKDRIFEEYNQKKVWGYIEEVAMGKLVVRWDTTGSRDQTHTTFYGDWSKSVVRNKDCWEVKL